jgi:hypothetical protein
LESFLESNVSKGNKLAVSDTKLGGAIQDTLKVKNLVFKTQRLKVSLTKVSWN